MMDRRKLLNTGILGAAAAASAAIPVPGFSSSTSQTVGERFWLWCHRESGTNGAYGIPGTSRITPIEAAAWLGLRNVIWVNAGGTPPAPIDKYIVPFRAMQRVVWQVGGSPGSQDPIIHLASLESNFEGLIFDDFFNGTNKDGRIQTTLTVSELRDFQNRLQKNTKRLDLWLVLYAHQLVDPISEHLKHCDVVTLWNWTAPEIYNLPASLSQTEKFAPGVRKVLGCYMWDYGQAKPMPIEAMRVQCEQGLTWLRQRRIEGMIFLASGICDLDLETVEWTRNWIKQVGSQHLG